MNMLDNVGYPHARSALQDSPNHLFFWLLKDWLAQEWKNTGYRSALSHGAFQAFHAAVGGMPRPKSCTPQGFQLTIAPNLRRCFSGSMKHNLQTKHMSLITRFSYGRGI